MATTKRGTPGGGNFPQLGGPGIPYQETVGKTGQPKLTEAGNPAMKRKYDIPDLREPTNQRLAIVNFAHSLESAPKATWESGKNWYPTAQAAVSHAISSRKGFLGGAENKMLSGASLFASVSPGSDWDRVNVQSLHELSRMKGKHINELVAGGARAKQAVKGLSLDRATAGNLQKAGRILQGEHPDQVFATSPKVTSFANNIADPANSQHVTIDGRAFDTMTNRMRSWDTGRGIGGASNPALERYHAAASVIHSVARQMDVPSSSAQAISWEHMKYGVEQQNRSRTKGPNRVGQPYFDPHTGDFSAAHLSSQLWPH